MKWKKKVATAALAVMLCVPAGQTYAFSWAPVTNAIDAEKVIMMAIQTFIKQQISNVQLGKLGKLGSVIGEIGRGRYASNDIFRAVIAGGIGGAVAKDPTLSKIFTDQIEDWQGNAQKELLGYINGKVLGTINDKTNGDFMFSLNDDGKIDIGIAVGKDVYEKYLKDSELNGLDLGGIGVNFENAENSRKALMEKQMNNSMERVKKLTEKNVKLLERINKNVEALNKNSEKVAAFQEKLKAFDATNDGGENESARQKLLEEMQATTMTTADINRVQASIAADRAAIQVNESIMEANKQSLAMMQESAKLQSERDREAKQKAEFKAARQQAEGYATLLSTVKPHDPSSLSEKAKKIFDD